MISTQIELFVALLLGIGALLPPAEPRPAYAAGTIVVNTTVDKFGTGAGCSLREAIQAANSDMAFGGCTTGSGTDTIVLQAGQTYALTTQDNTQYGFTGTPVIQSTIIIEGNGATITRASGAPSFRLFHVAKAGDTTAGGSAGAGDLTLHNVTLSNGAAVGAAGGQGKWGGGGGAGMGGTIYVRGSLTVERSTFVNNLAQGGNGGGVPSGILQPTGAGGGGGMGGPGGAGSRTPGDGAGGGGGWGGAGGNSALADNGSGEGGGIIAAGHDGSGASGGSGGSPEGGDGGSVGVNGSDGGGGGGGTFGGGNGGSGAGGGSNGTGGTGGPGGGGGGGAAVGGNGGGAAMSFRGIGGGGGGGANNGGVGSFAGGAGGSSFAGAGGGGGAGIGGAILNDGGTIIITNSTLSANRALGGTGGSAPGANQVAGGNGEGHGGAIFTYNATTTILASTIANNTAAQGGAAEWRADNGTVSHIVNRSIVAGSLGMSDCNGSFGSGAILSGDSFLSHDNLVVADAPVASFRACMTAGNSPDPKLDTLAVVAPGQTAIHTLPPSSPAINAVIGTCPETTDQRGIPRPVGPRCDIGAFELSSADLQIANGAPAEVAAGTNMVSTLTVTNNGPAWSSGVQVNDPTPTGLTFVSNAGACTTPFPCSLTSMAPGQQATITTTFAVPPDYAGANPVQTTASVSSLDDPVPGNDSASGTTTVQFQSDLSITKTDNRTVVPAGQAVAYSIVVSNAGPSTANGVRIQDTLPASLTNASWVCSGSGGAVCTPSGSGSIDTPANLPPSSHVTFSLAATLTASASGAVVNTATVTAPSGLTDPNPGNNMATDTDTVQTCANQHPVGVVTSHGGGVLTVVLTAGLGAIGSVQFGDPGQHPGVPTNAVIAVTSPGGGPGGITGSQTYTPPAGTTTVTLQITRSAAGSLTVPLVVNDQCGLWRTFVGAGASAAL